LITSKQRSTYLAALSPVRTQIMNEGNYLKRPVVTSVKALKPIHQLMYPTMMQSRVPNKFNCWV